MYTLRQRCRAHRFEKLHKVAVGKSSEADCPASQRTDGVFVQRVLREVRGERDPGHPAPSMARTLSCCHWSIGHLGVVKTIQEGLEVSTPMKGTACLCSIEVSPVKRLYDTLSEASCGKLKISHVLQPLTGDHFAHETREVCEADPIVLRARHRLTEKFPVRRDISCCQSTRKDGLTKLRLRSRGAQRHAGEARLATFMLRDPYFSRIDSSVNAESSTRWERHISKWQD